MLFQPNLAKAVGSDYVARRIEELRPAAHVFGHTHFSWDAVIDGVRYVQWPLAYPQERQCVPPFHPAPVCAVCGNCSAPAFLRLPQVSGQLKSG